MFDQVAGFPPAYEYLKCGRAFVLAVNGQASTYCGVGLCDPYLSSSFAALAPFRYFRSAFTWSVTYPALPFSGGVFTIPAGQSIAAFNTGFDETHSGDGLAPCPNNVSDTNAQSGGVNADRGQVFFASGMTVQAEDPFVLNADCSRQIIDALRPDAGYHSLLISDILNYAAYTFKFGNQGCEFKLGLAKHYPDWGGPSGDRATRNGQVGAPGLYLPFTVGICTGAKDEVKQLKMTIVIAATLVVGPVLGASPFSFDIPPSTDPVTLVKGPILTTLIGYICCVGDVNNCGMPVLTPEEVMVVKNTLRQNPAPLPPHGGLGLAAPVPAGYPQGYPGGYPQR
jgi:hypothetical protein